MQAGQGTELLCSALLQSVAVVQRAMRACDPADEMEEMGFGRLLLVSSFSVSMSGQAQISRVQAHILHNLQAQSLRHQAQSYGMTLT